MKLLDLFCGAGGAAMGYAHAGITDIVGIDIAPQAHYPFPFVQADALEYLVEHGEEYDVIHASPPCQGYSIMHNLPWLSGIAYAMLILPTMERLEKIGKPYILENVMGARYGAKGLSKRGFETHGLQAGWLCGTMFGLPFYRHRLFATNWFWLQPGHPKHSLNSHPRFERSGYGGAIKGLPGGMAGMDAKPRDPFHDKRDKSILGPGSLGKGAGLREYVRGSGKVETVTKKGTTKPGYGLTQWQNGAAAVGIGHAQGWRLAAENMGINWMTRVELTQAIPPIYTQFIGQALWQAGRPATV